MTDPVAAPPAMRRPPDARWVAAAGAAAVLLFAVLPLGPVIARLVLLSVLGAGALGVLGVRRRAGWAATLAALLALSAAVGVGAVLVARSLSPPARYFPAPHVVGMKLQAARRAFLSHAQVQFDIVKVPWADRNQVVRLRGLQWDGTYQDGTVIRLVVGTRPPR